MIMNVIDEALLAHKFTMIHQTGSTSFYLREEGAAIRFTILHRLDKLPNPSDLNELIYSLAPDSFLSRPEFRKNTDLVCINRHDNVPDFTKIEEAIFSIEEDPHFFKKYVLYHSKAEEKCLEDSSFDKISSTISDKNQFLTYKAAPLKATQYSVAAKIFIKLPFLELPFSQEALVPLRTQVATAVENDDLVKEYLVIQNQTDISVDEIIEEMISVELENITH